jgi:hypothetical protein
MEKNVTKQGLKLAKTAFYFKTKKRETVALSTTLDPTTATATTPTTGSLNCTM